MGLEALEEDREGQESLPEILEGLGGPGELGRPFQRARRIRRPLWIAVRGREALLESREGSGRRQRMGGPSRGREGSEGHPGGLRGSGGPSGRTGGMERGWEAHPDGRVVWKPSQQGREESGVPKGGQEGS